MVNKKFFTIILNELGDIAHHFVVITIVKDGEDTSPCSNTPCWTESVELSRCSLAAKRSCSFLSSTRCVISCIILFIDSLSISRSTALSNPSFRASNFCVTLSNTKHLFLRWVLTDPSNCCHCRRFLNPLVLMIWPSKNLVYPILNPF